MKFLEVMLICVLVGLVSCNRVRVSHVLAGDELGDNPDSPRETADEEAARDPSRWGPQLEQPSSKLCDLTVVQTVCDAVRLESDPAQKVSIHELGAALWASTASVQALITHVGFKGWASTRRHILPSQPTINCQDLCELAVDAVPEERLPPSIDVGCRHGDVAVGEPLAICDIDLSAGALKALAAPAKESMPNMHDKEDEQEEGQRNIAEAYKSSIDYTNIEMTRKVCNLFRIYPLLATTTAPDVSALIQVSSLEGFRSEAEADGLGEYKIMWSSTVTSSLLPEPSNAVTLLRLGTIVNVVEILVLKAEQRIRARIESPAGWISLQNTATGARWAEKVEKEQLPVNPAAGVQEKVPVTPAVVVQEQLPLYLPANGTCKKWCYSSNMANSCEKAQCKGCSHCGGEDSEDPRSRKKWTRDVEVRSRQAHGYIQAAIRNLKTQGTMVSAFGEWFGEGSHSDATVRQEVWHILNSVDGMLNNVNFIFPGPECEPQEYAYVYKANSYSKNRAGQFNFFLCPKYMESTVSVQIETINHEASHHATALREDRCRHGAETCDGNDKAYDRRFCKELALESRASALMNADNFCYFVNDVNGDFSR